MGCNTGTDVFVKHEGATVVLQRDGHEFITSKTEWAAAVLALVDQVEGFYAACTTKAGMDNDLDLEGWSLFWSEWESRKRRAVPSGA
jgi:hypothetical protein